MAETLYFVRSDSLGSDEVIGRRLMQSFFNNLPESLSGPVVIAFMNRGVMLALDDSPILASLRRLEERGCRILACGTCLDFYGAKERLGVGEVGSMPVVQEIMESADKVVTV